MQMCVTVRKLGVSNIGIGVDALRQGYQQARMMLKIGFYEDDSIIYYDPQKTISRNLPDAAQKVVQCVPSKKN